jgi:putative ATPase
VVVLEPLAIDELKRVLKKAIATAYPQVKAPDTALEAVANIAAGDARRALGIIEIALQLSSKLSIETIEEAAQANLRAFDKLGDMHYDIISAFIKSLRGSDETAALYYLARLLAGGEDPLFIARRMIIFASEDIGLAGNGALSLAVATFQTIERVGLPEAEYALYHCATALARSQKSRDIADKMISAKQLEKQFPNASVPLHLRNAPTELMKDLGYNKDYQWKANFQHQEGFLPTEIKDAKKS